MMLKIEKKIDCDICKSALETIYIQPMEYRNKTVSQVLELLTTTPFDKTVAVVFTTNQTDGAPTAPYLSMEKVVICPDCLQHMYSGNILFARGCQGYNKYYFKEPSNG